MKKILKVLAGFLSVLSFAMYIIMSIINNDWLNHIEGIFLGILFGIYAFRGNNWPSHTFKNLFKKDDGNDDLFSIDPGWLKNVLRRKKRI